MWHYGQSAFSAAVAVMCSEIGDNTFFVAVILSMTESRRAVFSGAMCANAIMHTISVFLASLLSIIPHAVTDWVSVICLTFLGTKMVLDGFRMSSNKTEKEYKEAEDEIKKHRKPSENAVNMVLSPVFLQSFTLTFFGEWGDRSQLSTIFMAAHSEWSSVLLGGFAGHAFCLLLATIGGSYIARKVSTRAMTMLGGVAFISFAAMTFLDMDV